MIIGQNEGENPKMTRFLVYGLFSLAVLITHLIVHKGIDRYSHTRTNNVWRSSNVTTPTHRRLSDSSIVIKSLVQNKESGHKKLRILYTVTTLAEYDTGGRATTKGYDRLQGVSCFCV